MGPGRPSRKKRRSAESTPAPLTLSKSRQLLRDNFQLPEDSDITSTVCRFGHILNLSLNKSTCAPETLKWIKEKFGMICHPLDISKLEKRFHFLSCGIAQYGMDKLMTFCNEIYVMHFKVTHDVAQVQPSSVSCSAPALSTSGLLAPSPAQVQPSSASWSNPVSSTSGLLLPSPAQPRQLTSPSTNPKTRSSDETPKKIALRRRLLIISSSAAKQKARYRAIVQKYKKMYWIPYQMKFLKQTLRRREDTNKKLKAKLKSLKRSVKEKQPKQQEQAPSSTRSKKDQVELQAKNQEIRRLEHEVDMLKEELESKNQPVSEEEVAKEGKSYTTKVRKIVYDMIMSQVPTRNIPSLISKVTQELEVPLTETPQRSTVDQMTRELGVIAELQAAESLMSNPHSTVGFDATTQEGVHINCVHITTSDRALIVAVDQLPGGTASDYADHITTSIDNLAHIYSHFHSADYQMTRQTMINNISNSMTDRAAVNHATITQVNSSWGKELNELNCHLHLLDTIATSCRSALRAVEGKKEGHLYGSDCIAGNIIVQISKLRYKDGKGNPQGFLIFLQENSLPLTLIPRFRGNRLHILFHTAGIIVMQYQLLLEFLETSTTSCGGLQACLLHDLSSKLAFQELCVLGLVGKLLTGPWMHMFYTSADTEMDHLSAVPVIKGVLEKMVEASKNPLELLDSTTDFFGQETSDDILKKICAECPRDDSVRDMIVSCLDAVISVLNRQYSKYFALDITQQLKTETQSARLHNMDCEEIMGMFSAAKSKAPNATLCFLSSKLRAIKNHTDRYLDGKTAAEKNTVITWAIKAARQKRHSNRLTVAALKATMVRRLSEKKQKIEDKERRRVESLLKSLSTTGISKITDVFSSLDEKAASDVTDILTNNITGRSICHTWHDEVNRKASLYLGKIEKFKRKNSNIYIVAYWKPEETYDESVDYEMNRFQLAADVVFGDLVVS